jgi:hypothetical protein
MSLVIELSPEVEERLRRAARSEGLEPEPYARRVLEETVAALPLPPEEVPPPRRVFGRYEGQIWMSEDFNEPLPDSFWLGEE